VCEDLVGVQHAGHAVEPDAVSQIRIAESREDSGTKAGIAGLCSALRRRDSRVVRSLPGLAPKLDQRRKGRP